MQHVTIDKVMVWDEVGSIYFDNEYFFMDNIKVYFKVIDESYPYLEKDTIYYLNSIGGAAREIDDVYMNCGLGNKPVYWIGTSLQKIYLGGE